MSELPPDELKPIFDKFAKGDGLIQFDEFEDICKSLKIRFEGPEVRRVYDQILEEGLESSECLLMPRCHRWDA